MAGEVIVSGAAYSFERLSTGVWLWSVQICNQPEHYVIGTQETEHSAHLVATAAEKVLRRLALRVTDDRMDRLGI